MIEFVILIALDRVCDYDGNFLDSVEKFMVMIHFFILS